MFTIRQERSLKMIITEQLPEHFQKQLKDKRRNNVPAFSELLKDEGYIPPNETILQDAVAALLMGKNVLLKGPTGSGKTKFAETLAHIFNQPMFSINCSIDLDAESLVGFKTLAYEDGKQTIEFVPGPVIQSMDHGTFLYIDEINMAKPETL